MKDALLLIIGAGVLAVAAVIGLAWLCAYLYIYRWLRSLKEPGGQA